MKNFPEVLRTIAGIGLLTSAMACAPISAALADDKPGAYLGREDVNTFIDELVTEHQFSRPELEAILGKAERSERALNLISRPAEGTLEWQDYRKIFITPERIAKGVEFWSANSDTLAEVEKDLGVPAHIIVAIIGVETYYGRQTGGFKVLDTLTTLGFDFPRRSAFFQKELKNLFLLAREQKLDITELTGSYAGAMGIPQFMPSSYRAYAVDFTGDLQANIWFSDEDAIASVANYLQKHGWRYGDDVAVQTQVSGEQADQVVSSGLKPDIDVQQLREAGWRVPTTVSAPALPMKMAGSNGAEYWLGLHNFYVITRYNRSQMYALAVHQLGQEVMKSYQHSLTLPNQG